MVGSFVSWPDVFKEKWVLESWIKIHAKLIIQMKLVLIGTTRRCMPMYCSRNWQEYGQYSM